MLYCADARSDVIEELRVELGRKPTLGEVSSSLSEQYKALTKAKKAKYDGLVEKDKERYNEDKKGYVCPSNSELSKFPINNKPVDRVEYVKEQTPEICLAAIKEDNLASNYVNINLP